MQESAFMRMCKVFLCALGLSVGCFFYSLAICGACTAGYFMGLILAMLVFGMTVFGGIVTYLE
jgi:hypothetical protein